MKKTFQSGPVSKAVVSLSNVGAPKPAENVHKVNLAMKPKKEKKKEPEKPPEPKPPVEEKPKKMLFHKVIKQAKPESHH